MSDFGHVWGRYGCRLASALVFMCWNCLVLKVLIDTQCALVPIGAYWHPHMLKLSPLTLFQATFDGTAPTHGGFTSSTTLQNVQGKPLQWGPIIIFCGNGPIEQWVDSHVAEVFKAPGLQHCFSFTLSMSDSNDECDELDDTEFARALASQMGQCSSASEQALLKVEAPHAATEIRPSPAEDFPEVELSLSGSLSRSDHLLRGCK